jgi:hypothetical protein
MAFKEIKIELTMAEKYVCHAEKVYNDFAEEGGEVAIENFTGPYEKFREEHVAKDLAFSEHNAARFTEETEALLFDDGSVALLMHYSQGCGGVTAYCFANEKDYEASRKADALKAAKKVVEAAKKTVEEAKQAIPIAALWLAEAEAALAALEA